MSARKSKIVITVDQAEWLEEHLGDVIGLHLTAAGAAREIVKEVGASKEVARALVDMAHEVRSVMGPCEQEPTRENVEDVVEGFKRLDAELEKSFKVKGRKRYVFRVGD